MKKHKLDQKEYLRHELLDRVSIQQEILSASIGTHAALIAKGTFTKAERHELMADYHLAQEALSRMYQRIGEIHL